MRSLIGNAGYYHGVILPSFTLCMGASCMIPATIRPVNSRNEADICIRSRYCTDCLGHCAAAWNMVGLYVLGTTKCIYSTPHDIED